MQIDTGGPRAWNGQLQELSDNF